MNGLAMGRRPERTMTLEEEYTWLRRMAEKARAAGERIYCRSVGPNAKFFHELQVPDRGRLALGRLWCGGYFMPRHRFSRQATVRASIPAQLAPCARCFKPRKDVG